jgi:archaellum component FlaC
MLSIPNKDQLKAMRDAIRAEMRQNTKDIIRDQRNSLQPIHEDLKTLTKDVGILKNDMTEVKTKLEAIMSGDVLVTRNQLLLVLEKLRAQDVIIEEREIFPA